MDKKVSEGTKDKIWDLVVIGFGPAGYTAGVYALRYNLDVLIVGEEQGGLVASVSHIENWPGDDKISGLDLMNRMCNHYLKLGGAQKECAIINLQKDNNLFKLKTLANEVIYAKTIILATGTKRKKLNVYGEDKFFGRGLSYCATCDAPFFKEKTVAVIGGGNSAFSAARHLSQFARKIYIIHRRDEFRAHPTDIEYMKDKAEYIMNSIVRKIEGKLKVEKLVLANVETEKEIELKVDGVFVEVGQIPTTSLISELGVETEEGFVKVNEDMSTNISGFFAAGDCTNGLNKMKQIVTATAMGAISAETAYKYVKG